MKCLNCDKKIEVAYYLIANMVLCKDCAKEIVSDIQPFKINRSISNQK